MKEHRLLPGMTWLEAGAALAAIGLVIAACWGILDNPYPPEVDAYGSALPDTVETLPPYAGDSIIATRTITYTVPDTPWQPGTRYVVRGTTLLLDDRKLCPDTMIHQYRQSPESYRRGDKIP